jgi:hypothetical protein
MVGTWRVFQVGAVALFASWGRLGTARFGSLRVLRLEFAINTRRGHAG